MNSSSTANHTERKLQRFADLSVGWHYGEGRSIDVTSLERARLLNRKAIRLAFYETDAFPGLNGEVSSTVYVDDHYLEFTFEPDGTVTFCHEEADREICYEEELSFEGAKARLEEFRSESTR